MAEMLIKFDTETKKFSATVDGKAVANAVGAEVYPWSFGDKEEDNEWRCSITAYKRDEATGISETLRLCASQTADAAAAKKAGGTPSSEFPGFVEVVDKNSKAEAAIADLFGCKE